MNFKSFLSFLLLSFFFVTVQLDAQKAESAVNQKSARYPASFFIGKTDFDYLFTLKPNEVIRSENNVFIDKSVISMNTLNGDTKFLKMKLDYFKHAWLLIQVNGVYSTQIFILSDDKSVFYKGSIHEGKVTMTKCNEDDIVSE